MVHETKVQVKLKTYQTLKTHVTKTMMSADTTDDHGIQISAWNVRGANYEEHRLTNKMLKK